MRTLKICLIMILAVIFSVPLSAQEIERRATIVEFSGKVEVENVMTACIPAHVGMVLSQGDILRTKDNSSAKISLDDKEDAAIVDVKENSQLAISELVRDKEDQEVTNTLLDLAIGEILVKAKKLRSGKSKFEVRTPTSFIGIRGTEFSVSVKAVE